jgi:hypothetical protein
VQPIGAEALKPNARLAPFAPFIGRWRTEGRHPLLPGRALEGRASFAWHEGGAFVLLRTEMRQPEIPPATALFGSDDEGAIVMLYFDCRGVSGHYRVAFEGGAMHWSRDSAAGLSQRMTFTPGEDGRTLHQTGRMSEQGGSWQEDLALIWHREERD